MENSGSKSPIAPPQPHTWRSGIVGLGLFCAIAGLFLAAGFKEALWPKAVAIGGVVILVAGLAVNAVVSRLRPASGD